MVNVLSTIVVVHDKAVPEARVLIALRPDDLVGHLSRDLAFRSTCAKPGV